MCLRMARPAISRVGRGGRPGTSRVDRPEALLEEAPVDRARSFASGWFKIDDLVEPGSEQIRLPGLAPLLGSHGGPPS